MKNLKEQIKISVSLTQPRNATISSGDNGENATLATVHANISLADGTPLITNLRGRLYAFANKGQDISESAPKIDFTNASKFTGTDGKEIRMNALIIDKDLQDLLLYEAVKTLNEVGYKGVDEVESIAEISGASKEEISNMMKGAINKALAGRETVARTAAKPRQSLINAARAVSSESLPTD